MLGGVLFAGPVGASADVDRPRGGGFEPLLPVGSGEPDDAETGAEALFGMRAFIEDQVAQRRGGRPDHGGILADALDGPAGVAPMTGCHVLRYGRVLVVAAHPLMRGDPLTLVENLDGAGSEAHLDLGADEAMRDAVVMRLDLDVIVDADPADPPLGAHVRGLRQGLECRPVDLLEQLAAGGAQPPGSGPPLVTGHRT